MNLHLALTRSIVYIQTPYGGAAALVLANCDASNIKAARCKPGLSESIYPPVTYKRKGKT